MRFEERPAVRYGDCVKTGEEALPGQTYCNCSDCRAFYGFRAPPSEHDNILVSTVRYLKERGYTFYQVATVFKRL